MAANWRVTHWHGFETQMIKYLSFFWLLLLCSSCSTPQVNSTPGSQSPAKLSPPKLGQLSKATMVEIHNDWNGYSDITPILRHYKLRHQNQQLIGNAHFAVGGYGAASIRQQLTKKVKVPTPLAQKFFDTLSKTPVEIGPYKPLIKRADDYPDLMIHLTLEGKKITFSSQSQGNGNVPWKIIIADRDRTAEYISNSPLPAQALKSLDSVLNNSGIDAIIHRKRHSRS
jgi:hypothetical protein